MKEGFWGNYEIVIWFQIDEHERWLRRGNNAEKLGVPKDVIAEFPRFADRETLLPFVWRHAPVMRWRCHGESVTFEFYAEDWTRPLELIRKWCILRKDNNRPDRRNVKMEIDDSSRADSKTPEDIIKEIIKSAEETTNKFSAMTAETLLFEGKFGTLGTKWDDSEKPYDLGEQIQQSMTMLVTCYAIKEYFFERYGYPFRISPAGKNGQDISDKEGQMTCEIFAAKKSTNNQKLWHDLNAVAVKDAQSKFVFFCSPDEIKISKGDKHSSKNFSFELDNVEYPKNTNNKFCEISVEVTGRDKSKQKEYKKKNISVIHVTPCVVHQWFRTLSLSGGSRRMRDDL